MGSFIINGGKGLSGELEVSGSKNAALPLIFASLTVRGTSVLDNVPDIEDVRIALKILEYYGVSVASYGDRLLIDASRAEYSVPPRELVSKIRASSYLMGASLSRFGKAYIPPSGGCNFDIRPIDLHLFAMQMLGAEISGNEIIFSSPRPAEIHFPKKSVGASINAIISASSVRGVSRIYGYAEEPHVLSLIDFYRSAGIDITQNSECIEIHGKEIYHAHASVIPDMIEAGTYIIASLMLSSPILIRSLDVSHLSYPIALLSSCGARFEYTNDGIIPYGRIEQEITLETAPYPGFPTDLQPQMAPLLALASGGEIRERVWSSRFSYLNELSRFGVKYELRADSALIHTSALCPAEVTSPDLRGGAALILAALAADGQSKIRGAEIIDRGYENIVKKLASLGASINREE